MKKVRKPNKLYEGSLAWRASQLAVGECLLLPSAPGKSEQRNLLGAIRNAKTSGRLDGEYIVRTCIGIADDKKSLPFKFYRIERVS